MKYLLPLLLAFPLRSKGQYWNWDFRLPRLSGVRKVIVTETRWDYAYNKPPKIQRYRLRINQDGLVDREDAYDERGRFSSRTTYGYLGNDTAATYIRVFYDENGPELPAVRTNRKSTRVIRLRNTVEYVDEHGPLHQEWRSYRLEDSPKKTLLDITSSNFDAGGRPRFDHYYSYESFLHIDSTAYRYSGDTVFSETFSVKGTPFGDDNSRNDRTSDPTSRYRSVTLQRNDSAGRPVYYERLENSQLSHPRNITRIFYDRQGRYQSETYERDCDDCERKWETGGQRLSYDAKGRPRSMVYSYRGHPSLRYDLVYLP